MNSYLTWSNVPDNLIMMEPMKKSGNMAVSALFEPRGSIFQNGFLSGVLLIFDLPGVVIETGVY